MLATNAHLHACFAPGRNARRSSSAATHPFHTFDIIMLCLRKAFNYKETHLIFICIRVMGRDVMHWMIGDVEKHSSLNVFVTGRILSPSLTN